MRMFGILPRDHCQGVDLVPIKALKILKGIPEVLGYRLGLRFVRHDCLIGAKYEVIELIGDLMRKNPRCM